jgi:Zn-dependent M28 family amino/carboxypeptidase
MADARAITAFGVRPGGSEEERLAAEYIAQRLGELGYEPRIETFELPNGTTSRNVIASLPGSASSRSVILGAHFDTKPPSPGANDNASGCGVVLELARLLKAEPAAGRTDFVFYGTEEYLVDAPGDNHHLGSRDHAARLSAEEIANTAAMISVDMVGYGTRFHVRTMKRGPQTLSDYLLGEAKLSGVKLSFLKDLGKTGWSDHEPYELKGIPSVWLQWQSDPQYHTPGDDAEHLRAKPIEVTGSFLLEIVRGFDESDLERFCDR